MLKIRQDFWPDDDNPSERYLWVSGDCIKYGEARIEIFAEGVFADDTEIIFRSKAQLDEWVRVLSLAWDIKTKQDKKGWRKR